MHTSRLAASALTTVITGFMLTSGPTAWAGTEVLFTKPVDPRFAWLGNDAQGGVDFQTTIINLINGATSSIDVATMTFGGVPAIADALKDAADSGIRVRIVGNRAHRLGEGYVRAMRGPVHIIDNNHAALFARVNFQSPGAVTPAGWLADEGAAFGNRGAGWFYGWSANAVADMQSTADASYTSPLLGDCYARPNSSGSRNWEIELPNGYYYVHLAVGQPSFTSKAYIQVEGQNVFKFGATFGQYHNCGIGEFKGATADGGEDSDNPGVAQSRRIQVNDGRLTIKVGEAGQAAWSSLCYVEIYRGDSEAYGDTYADPTHLQRDGLHHSKFLLIDGDGAMPRLWTSSGNLTAAMTFMSEDAIITDDPSICAAYRNQFNQLWGAAGALPDPVVSRFGRFKVDPLSNLMVYNPYLMASHNWRVMFCPSIGALNMGDELEAFLDATQDNLIFNLEQFTSAAAAYGVNTSGYLMNNPLLAKVMSGIPLYGLFGNQSAADPIFSVYDAYPNATVAQVETINGVKGLHNKLVLRDALGDTRFQGRGRLLCGSMNWSQSAMVHNDEQALLITDPAIANQYLQRAMAALDEEGIALDRRADVILVLDRSYSMNALTDDGITSKIAASRAAAKLFIDLLAKDAGHRVSLIRFGETVEPFMPAINLQPLTNMLAGQLKTQVDNVVADLPIGAWTCYGLPLLEAQAQLGVGPVNPRQVVHFFTDGMENKAPFADGIYQPLAMTGAEIHSTAFGAFNLFGSGVTAVLDDMATASGGTFAQVPNDLTELSKRFIEVARDAMDLDSLLDPTYLIDAKTKAYESIDVDASATRLKFIATWDQAAERQAKLTIWPPYGKPLDVKTPGVSITDGPGHHVVHVDTLKLQSAFGAPTEGTWRIEIAAGEKFGELKQMNVDLVVLGDTDVDFRAEVAAAYAGDPKVQLLSRMLDRLTPVANAGATVTWQQPLPEKGAAPKPIELPLYDDGKHGDGAKGDGLFGLALDLKSPGNHRFHFVSNAVIPGEKVSQLAVRRESNRGYTVSLK